MANIDRNNYINNELYKTKENILRKNYQSEAKTIDRQKKDQLQAAAISHQRLLKYLPEYNASIGLHGNGASETALLDANARYRSEQGQIAAAYDAQKAAAQQKYNQNLLDLYTQAEAKYEQEQEKLKQEQTENYNLALDAITNWSAKDAAGLTAYYEGMKGKMSDTAYNSLLNTYKNKLEEAEAGDATAAIVVDDIQDGLVTVTGVKQPNADGKVHDGDNIQVSDGDKNYSLELGGAIISGNAWQAAQNSQVSDGQIFMYEGKIYYKQGNTVREVRKRASGSQISYDNLKLLLTGQAAPVSDAPKVNRYRSMG